jgi:hypothetical protein
VVSIEEQKAYVFRAGKLIGVTTVSTGKRGHSTPTGSFTILQKNRRHFSNLYNNAPMPNMQRLTWGGIALHAGALPGLPGVAWMRTAADGILQGAVRRDPDGRAGSYRGGRTGFGGRRAGLRHQGRPQHPDGQRRLKESGSKGRGVRKPSLPGDSWYIIARNRRKTAFDFARNW